jgi:hypothetical protein
MLPKITTLKIVMSYLPRIRSPQLDNTFFRMSHPPLLRSSFNTPIISLCCFIDHSFTAHKVPMLFPDLDHIILMQTTGQPSNNSTEPEQQHDADPVLVPAPNLMFITNRLKKSTYVFLSFNPLKKKQMFRQKCQLFDIFETMSFL